MKNFSLDLKVNPNQTKDNVEIKTTRVYHNTILPKYLGKNFTKEFDDNLGNNRASLLNLVDLNKLAEIIIKNEKDLIQTLCDKYKDEPELSFSIETDKDLKQIYIDVKLLISDTVVFEDKLYEYFTKNGLKYEINNGKLCEFDKDWFKLLNDACKEHGINTYKEYLINYHKDIFENEYNKRLEYLENLNI